MKPIKVANSKLFEHDGNEHIIGEARRHFVGILMIIGSSALISFFLLLLLAVVEKNQDSFQASLGIEPPMNITGLLGLVVAGMLVLVFAGMALGIYIYRHNYIVLTDQKLVIVHSYSVIRRRVSQLSIGDIQDISVAQNTLMSRIFKYGTVLIETSGEQANLHMNMISNPFEVSKAIVDAHENNLKLYGN